MSIIKTNKFQTLNGQTYQGVIQVVQYHRPPATSGSSSLLATSSAVWGNIMSASITPYFSSSKILVLSTFTGYSSGGVANAQTRIMRTTDNTLIGFTRYASYYNDANSFSWSTYSILDNPNTTNQVTYTVQGAWINGPTVYFGYGDGGGNEECSLTLMEISQ